uniref:Nucleotide exchange factor Fes1 domain-containing protein n=1 Tax=Chromera velia CCMP2878 TaxID=1169474 RepID=A0A0G4I325_9ALVE|mmetsp:Transcript_8511/g.16613  ORF Transcript_8511/g.16613 Transcript_8511/m.16613 type:complete len:342 (-) Transcript_8511:240-1265(-)|eukprot:Cvel_10559.t1-p1 / transcript=Cvel_10559.t1 / gene=Cvel_10559 / organism=Chromera_velia_CCMP2878 / gene_product=Hsp70 nucleotide exchange factor FES1, putative / transcript_product=Hsp70 nucleotide exchange factor FES1, putative / location=Cvel_scaffold639:42845-43974(-) / protein_length=341 / sequence_SO=supercontig / SO=protein_coding / is_pseudo=false
MPEIDWPGLLKWSLKYNDGTGPGRRLTDEDMAFLQGAIQEAMKQVVDSNQLIEQSVPKLLSPDPKERLAALGIIEKCMDQPDAPRNLEKLGALRPLIELLGDDIEDVVLMSLQILSLALQNNPQIQSAASQHGALEALDRLVVGEALPPPSSAAAGAPKSPALTAPPAAAGPPTSPRQKFSQQVQLKALGALSGLIRHNTAAELLFVNRGGVAVLRSALTSEWWKVRQKAATLLRHLLHEKRVPERQIDWRLVEVVAWMMAQRDVDSEGIEYGEVTGEMVRELLSRHKPQIVRTGKLINLQQAIDCRLAAVKTAQSRAPAVEREYFEEELKMLKELLALAS